MIICRKDDSAIGAMLSARNMGHRIPDDLSVIGHVNIPSSSLLVPPLTTIDLDFARLGACGASLLMQQIQQPDTQLEPTETITNLLLRGSHGAALQS